jgi:hypothetical protein
MQEENDRGPKSRVEVVKNESERPEEGLRHQEGQVDNWVEGPKPPADRSRRVMK